MNKRTALWVNGEANIPKYVQEIVKQVRWIGLYTYKLVGVNAQRPGYGVFADVDRLKAWAERHGAEFIIKHENSTPKNYYVEFEMSDPVAQALEKAGFLT